MGGGLMQLVAYGAQDIYLTGNPQITFFKVVYRRHTNFSMEAIQQTISGSSTGITGGEGTVIIARNGDLVHRIYVNAADDTTKTCTSGSDIVKEAELEIGGQMIDRHWTEWNNIWNELSTPESKAIGLKAMQGDIGEQGDTGVTTIQVPLNFWFCRNPGLALPLIALQYHEVKVKFTWGGTGNGTVDVYADYIYLDTDERRRFAQVSHEYLIEQVQKIDASSTKSLDLPLNHPVKELIWTGSSYGTAELKLNGHERFSAQQPEYFQLRQPFDHHTAVPRQNLPVSAQLTSNMLVKGDSVDVEATAVPNEVVSGKGLGNSAGGTETIDGDVTHMAPFIFASGKTRFTYNTSTQTVVLAADTDKAEYTASIAAGTGGIAVQSAGPLATTLNGLSGRRIELTGTNFKNPDAGSGGLTTTVTLLQHRVGLAADGRAASTTGEIDVDVTLLFFDKQVLTSEDDGAVGAGGATTISSIKVYETAADLASEARTSKMTKKINVYSFALKPEEHQPSGTCNFSRIDSAQLVTSDNLTGTVYAVNYNVLRIMSGMGGLAYSN